MTDYQKYINSLRKCAKEHEKDRTFTGHIIVSDLCRDTANLLEALEQEPTTKNDLAVDKLISDCEKMSFDMEIFNKPLKVVALDAVKNIVKDLPSVTPQEPRWIPVTEDTPPKGTICLWCNKQGSVFTSEITYRSECSYRSEGSSFVGKHGYFSNGLENYGNIVAWMPLPKPYKPQESEE